MSDARNQIVLLTGGVGGAKLALGLYSLLPPGALTVIVNTGDDFTHLGLRICPDLDTTVYTLAGIADSEQGWGRQGETWTFMRALAALGGETWFQLGDGDLALHVERTRRLAAGETLSAVTAAVAGRLGIGATVVPMSDDPVATLLETDAGVLPFQDYFVRRRAVPAVQAIRFEGAARARLADGARAALGADSLKAVIIAPSNPYLSIDPLRALPGFETAVRARGVPVIAVTPLIGGAAVKGPTAKIMRELGRPVTPKAVAEHYGSLIDGFILDARDRDHQRALHIPTKITDTLMETLADRKRVAEAALTLAESLRGAAPGSAVLHRRPPAP